MTSQNRLSRFSHNLLITVCLVVSTALAFALYVRSRVDITHAHELRYLSFQLADELRQSSDDLTRMVRTYVVTGDPVYKKYYQDILDIRNGKKPRPEEYQHIYWDMVTANAKPLHLGSRQPIALLELMRQAGVVEQEFRKLAEAKANSDGLTAAEFEAMKLVESGGPAAGAKARMMLYDDKYHQAKAAIMKPIDEFYELLDKRTLDTVHAAESSATILRYISIALGLGLMFMLWRTYTTLRDTLGGGVDEVYAQIAKIGSGDFSSAISGIKVNDGLENSVLGWLSETQVKLNDIERERKRKEGEFRTLIQTSLDGFWINDFSGRILDVNEALCQMLGYTREEFLRLQVRDFEASEAPEETAAHIQKIIRTGSDRFQTRQRRKDGAVIDVEASAQYSAELGERIFSFIRDITERKRAEESLHRIEWMLTEQPAAAPEAPQIGQAYGDLTPLNTSRVILDAVGHELLADIVADFMRVLETSSAIYEKNGDYANGIFASGWCKFMDMASRNLCGTPDNRAALSGGKWLCHESCWNEASLKSIETGSPADIECAGGIHLYAVPIRAGDEIVGSINVGYGDPPKEPARLQELSTKYAISVEELRREAEAYETRPPFIIELAKNRLHVAARLIGEIVQRKRAEEKIHQLNAELEQRVAARTAQLKAANTDLENFSYSVSHDLRAPLRAIDGFASILREDYAPRLDDEGKRLFKVVSDNAQKMGQLIDDILAFSRAGRSELQLITLDMNVLVQQVWQELEPQRAGRAIELRLAPLPSASGDPAAVRQVLENLLDNAVKFTRGREAAVIEVAGHREGDENIYSIRDNGAGFDMAYVAKLFGLFQRLHGMEEFEGTGVGLAIVKRFITKLGGRVWAEGKTGEGATFWFTLPAETIAE